MHSKKPIRLSTWTLIHKTYKDEVRIVRDVIVSGTEEDISSIKNNSLYLGRVYRQMFGKKNFLKKMKDAPYTVHNVELDEMILGCTNVQKDE